MPSGWLLVCATHLAIMAPTLVEHVVADAGAFLKKVPLQVRFRAVFLPSEAPPRRIEASVSSQPPAVALLLIAINDARDDGLRSASNPPIPSCLHLLTPYNCRFLSALSSNYLTFFLSHIFHQSCRIVHGAGEYQI